MVRLAVLKFVKRDARGNPNGDCSDAVERFMREVLMRRLPEEALQNSNAFRMKVCGIIGIPGGSTCSTLWSRPRRDHACARH